MATVPTSARRERLRKTVPKMVECAEKVLYGDIWERKELSKRDRSMITIAALLTSCQTRSTSGSHHAGVREWPHTGRDR